jgi:hypothetical protein
MQTMTLVFHNLGDVDNALVMTNVCCAQDQPDACCFGDQSTPGIQLMFFDVVISCW